MLSEVLPALTPWSLLLQGALRWFHTNGLCAPLGSRWGWGCQPSLGFPAAFPAIVLPCSSDQLGCCEAARVSGARPRLRGTELS